MPEPVPGQYGTCTYRVVWPSGRELCLEQLSQLCLTHCSLQSLAHLPATLAGPLCVDNVHCACDTDLLSPTTAPGEPHCPQLLVLRAHHKATAKTRFPPAFTWETWAFLRASGTLNILRGPLWGVIMLKASPHGALLKVPDSLVSSRNEPNGLAKLGVSVTGARWGLMICCRESTFQPAVCILQEPAPRPREQRGWSGQQTSV